MIWQLTVAPVKCTVMRVRSDHSFKCSRSYYVGIACLPVVSSCTNLGILFDNQLSVGLHVSKIVVNASCRAKFTLKCFRSLDSQLLVRAFCTFVRLLLEFSSIIWRTYIVTDINRIESVLRSFTGAIRNSQFSTYEEHLVNLCLYRLQCRRVKANLVFGHKLMHELADINSTNFITLSSSTHLCGNQIQLVKPRSAYVRDAN
jgi:hypothetical protein